jgi:hypothetical protein
MVQGWFSPGFGLQARAHQFTNDGFIDHPKCFPHRRTFFVRQRNKLIGLGPRGGVVSAKDARINCDPRIEDELALLPEAARGEGSLHQLIERKELCSRQ